MWSAAGTHCHSWRAMGVEVGVSLSACQRSSTAPYIVMPIEGTIRNFRGKALSIIERCGRTSCPPNQENRRSGPTCVLGSA